MNSRHIYIVGAVAPANLAGNRWTIKEVGLLDPRDREPIRDGWDGLLRIVAVIKPLCGLRLPDW